MCPIISTVPLWCLIGFSVYVIELNVQLLSQFIGVYMIQHVVTGELRAMLIRSRVAEPANCVQITLKNWRWSQAVKSHCFCRWLTDEMWLKYSINIFFQPKCPPWSSYPNRSVVSADSCNWYIRGMFVGHKKMKHAWYDGRREICGQSSIKIMNNLYLSAATKVWSSLRIAWKLIYLYKSSISFNAKSSISFLIMNSCSHWFWLMTGILQFGVIILFLWGFTWLLGQFNDLHRCW